MSELTIDALARLAAQMPAGARSAGRAQSLTATGNKKKDSAKKQAKKKCRQQGAQCQALVASRCEGDQACLDAKKGCCTFASTCNFSGFLVCFSN